MRTPAQTYEDSGWCFIESIISAGIKVGARRLDLAKRTKYAMGKGYRNIIWGGLEEVCAAKRTAPIHPDEAARLLREVKIFTAGSDVDKVIELYRSFFEGVSQSTVVLSFISLEWGDEEAVQLAAVLPSFARLEKLFLGNNQIGDAGAIALAEACGQLPKLKELHLDSNRIGDAGAAALAEACRQLPQLKVLTLENNQIGDAGAIALAEACRQLPKLKALSLIGNQIGDAGMAALAEAIAKEGAFPSLTKIGLNGNPASGEAQKAVKEALEKKKRG